MNMESPEKEPELPEDVTAEQLLNEYSEKSRAEMAAAQGFSLIAFDRYLNFRMRRERVSASIAQVDRKLASSKVTGVERDPNQVESEKAIIRGLQEAVRKLGPEHLSEETIETLEREAYTAVEDLESTPIGYDRTMKEKQIEKMFNRVFEARAQNEIDQHIEKGMTDKEARKVVADAFVEKAMKTNLRELKWALERTARKLYGGFVYEGREACDFTELRSIIDGYGKRELAPEEAKLLAAFVKDAKARYFDNKSRYSDNQLAGKYSRVVETVASAYRKYGPHKRTSEGVSGPTEVYTPHQSGREQGYRRTGKARPHRDPSGGSGEN